MTNQEAKEWLGKQTHYFSTLENAERDQECRKVIYEALEKQIPKKPIADKYGIVTICPHCNIRMRSQEITVDNWGGKHFVSVRDKHCKDCGQAIDWSDE